MYLCYFFIVFYVCIYVCMCVCVCIHVPRISPTRFSRVVPRHETRATATRAILVLSFFLELDLKTQSPTPVNRLLLPNRVESRVRKPVASVWHPRVQSLSPSRASRETRDALNVTVDGLINTSTISARPGRGDFFFFWPGSQSSLGYYWLVNYRSPRNTSRGPSALARA